MSFVLLQCSLRPSEQTPSALLGENLRRIFIERGFDFLEHNNGNIVQDGLLVAGNELPDDSQEQKDSTETSTMTTEQLYRMRMEILPQLL